eukprot:scpid10161/ scgid33999/ 
MPSVKIGGSQTICCNSWCCCIDVTVIALGGLALPSIATSVHFRLYFAAIMESYLVAHAGFVNYLLLRRDTRNWAHNLFSACVSRPPRSSQGKTLSTSAISPRGANGLTRL